jgi:hypothetical protein
MDRLGMTPIYTGIICQRSEAIQTSDVNAGLIRRSAAHNDAPYFFAARITW